MNTDFSDIRNDGKVSTREDNQSMNLENILRPFTTLDPNKFGPKIENEVAPKSNNGFSDAEMMISGQSRQRDIPQEIQNTSEASIQLTSQPVINDIPDVVNSYRAPLETQENMESSNTFLVKFKRVYIFGLKNIICMFLIIFNTIFAYQIDSVRFPYLMKMMNQFQSSAIIDLFLIDRKDPCQIPYQSSSMGLWPGYKSTCKCSSTIYDRECSIDDLNSGCSSIGPYKPAPVTVWDGKKICIRRSSKTISEYYLDSQFIENPVGTLLCPNELKKCIISSLGNFVCVNRYELCPITKIMIDQKEILLTPNRTRWKFEYEFDTKVLLLDNEMALGTIFFDLIVQANDCEHKTSNYDTTHSCISEKSLIKIDNFTEYSLLQSNIDDINQYSSLQSLKQSYNLYTIPGLYLEQCSFNMGFNPVTFIKEIRNWDRIKGLLYINPFFLSTLFVLNILRSLSIRYLDKNLQTRNSQLRRKEFYNILGKYLIGGFLIITCEIAIILYFILWGYLLLNENKLYFEKWAQLRCLEANLKGEFSILLGKVNQIESYNMIVIGPMIVACIVEALISQHRILRTDVYDQLRELP